PANPAAAGWLALVATPIGNLEDLTPRAIRTLQEAEVIAAEDTRRAGILCQRHGITARLLPYHAFNEHRRTAALLDEIAAGRKVALVSDAGTPALSDPGFLVVREALARGIEPRVIPGVSALTFAIVAAGLPVHEFAFLGFPPVKPGRRRALLERIRTLGMTVFLFESPFRITRLLTEIVATLGPQTRVALVREATKLHEETLRGTAGELLARHRDRAWKGEFVVGISLTEDDAAPPAGCAPEDGGRGS
ncbi:MAG: 16S rRNA (cytidine(1402)-2'-O)-methyltransferase, partial [Lentisphaeria bacterium]